MLFVWIVIFVLAALILVFKRNHITFSFLGSAFLTLISYFFIKDFAIQLCIYVIIGIIGSVLITKLHK